MCQDDIAARVRLEKSTGAPGKTTARQESALLRMVHEYRFKSDCALNERMKNLYGVCVGHKTINNGLVASGYRVCRTLRKPLLTANHRRLRLYWARGWQNCRENASSKTARLTCQVDRVQAGGWGWGWGDFLQGCPLCSWIETSVAWCMGTSCEIPWYHLLGSTLEIIFTTKMRMLCPIIPR